MIVRQLSLTAAAFCLFWVSPGFAATSGVRKVEDIVIHRDDRFYSAFPSIVRRPDGELLVAFRRAPERRAFGNPGAVHHDPNSYLVMTRSRDAGRTWSQPQAFFAHPFGGAQDPCMVQLRDGTILCSSYAWMWLPPGGERRNYADNFAFLGGFLLRSRDGGLQWDAAIASPTVAVESRRDPFGGFLPAYNRGAILEGRAGRLFWVIATRAEGAGERTENHLVVSDDQGDTWTYACPVAVDEKVTFNEASLYETPKGNVVAFLRTGGFGDHLVTARSTDGGKTFQPWEDAGFRGHPFHALRLPDKRVLLVYGYRHKPFGIRAKVLNEECTDVATAPEIVLRDDGGTSDLGYPWSTLIADDRVMVVYYFNRDNGTRSIEATVLDLGGAR